MAYEEHTYGHLEELGGSKFEIVDDEPNIKGWDVKTGDGLGIGSVHDLLFNPQSRKVRYLVVDMNGNELHLDEGRRVLIPIGIAELYSKRDYKKSVVQVHRDGSYDKKHDPYDPAYDGNVVVLPGVNIAQLNALPLYEKDHLSPDIEMAIRKIFESSGQDSSSVHDHTYNRDKFYDHDHFNEDKFYKHSHKKHTQHRQDDDK